ncbi:MAG: aldolase [Planctomycetes bacterium]|nr:aldolase [Planctomycetota bacterium]
MLTLMLICNAPEMARAAVESGVDRIFIDLEQLGKRERQRGRDTVISAHSLADIAAVRRTLPRAEILVRTNPVHDGLPRELDEILACRVDVLMLPMFTTRDEVDRFVDGVAGRARVCLLVETPQAFTRLPWILERAGGIEEVYLGLNDLHLGLGLRFLFECLAGGLVDHAAAQVRAAGLRFGFGGIGRLGSGAVSADLVLSEHVRLGSSLVILSRAFLAGLTGSMASEVARLRAEEARLRALPAEELERNRKELNRRIWAFAAPPAAPSAEPQRP